MFANMVDKKWSLISIYNCIVLISSEAEYVFICFLSPIKSVNRKNYCTVVFFNRRKQVSEKCPSWPSHLVLGVWC